MSEREPISSDEPVNMPTEANPEPGPPERIQGKLNPFDPTAEPGIEEERLARVAATRKERLLEARPKPGQEATPEWRRAQALYEEASSYLRECRGYWRGIGEFLGVRGAVSVQDHAVGVIEIRDALRRIITDPAQLDAALAELSIDPGETP